MFVGVTEAFTPEQFEAQLDANLVGPFRVCRAALPQMREERGGLLLHVSTVAGAEPVIPPKANRTEQRDYDANLYADRNKIERLFNRLKHYRRVATRYEKLGRNYLSFVHLAAAMTLLL